MKNFSCQAVQTHIERPYVSLIYEWFHFWNGIPWSPTLFPAARQECRPRKGAPPRVSGLRFAVPPLTGRNSLPAVAQTVVPSSRSGPSNLPPAGRPPTERAGSCTNACLCRAFFGMHSPYEIVLSHGGADPHREYLLSFIPVEFLRRRVAAPLCLRGLP